MERFCKKNTPTLLHPLIISIYRKYKKQQDKLIIK